MTRLVRLNASQRAVFESVDINDRRFLQIDLLEANDDGSERLTRLLVDASRLESFAAAMLAAAAETPIAALERSYD